MATVTNVPQSVQLQNFGQQQNSAVVQFPAKNPITQLELAAFLSLRGEE